MGTDDDPGMSPTVNAERAGFKANVQCQKLNFKRLLVRMRQQRERRHGRDVQPGRERRVDDLGLVSE